jgi:hypothetical protein
MIGRRRPDTARGDLPDDLRDGDYWKVLNRVSGRPAKSEYPSNLTGLTWEIYLDGFGVAGLEQHTVREHEDGTITVAPGDGSSNSILVSKADGRSWHGYIRRGEFY